MFTLPVLSLLLATSALASPVRRDWSSTSNQTNSVTSPWSLSQPLPPPLTAIAEDVIVDVVVAVGLETFTCSPSGTYSAIPTEVEATLFEINIEIEAEIISTISNIAYNSFTSPNWSATQFMQEYNLSSFGQMTGTQDNGVLIPVWTNTSSTGGSTNSPNVSITGHEVDSVPQENSANWVEYNVWGGQTVNTVYMVNTVNGLSPNTPCAPGSTQIVDFTAIYVFVEADATEVINNY